MSLSLTTADSLARVTIVEIAMALVLQQALAQG